VEEYCLILFSLRVIEGLLFCSLTIYRGTKKSCGKNGNVIQ